MSAPELILYTRPDCHLCEVAGRLLRERGLEWRTENIEDDLDLIRRYGDKVPVLFRPGDGAELAWPFDAQGLRLFIEAPL